MEQSEIQKLKFEEYKLFVEDTARFTERRQTITNIYVAVNSILLAGIGLLLDSGFQNLIAPLAVIAILIAGTFICAFWRQLIRKYKILVGFRINMLREIEEQADMQWSHQMYHREDMLFPRDENDQPVKNKGLNFSDLESRLPLVFIIVYTALAFFLAFVWIFEIMRNSLS
jgi:hypothetical protein